MKALILVSFVVLAASPFRTAVDDARGLLERGEVDKAAERLAEMLDEKPNDPWLLYNAGVVAYAAKEYEKADALWQRLATMELPEPLRDQVWLQIGNASFRMAEAVMDMQPASAVAKIEQSREAYRIAMAQNAEGQVAPKNLAFVEKQLEELHARLAARLVSEAKQEKTPEPAIEKLQAALDHQQNATALNPRNPQHGRAEREIEHLLAEKFVEKAGNEEKEGDRMAEHKSLDQPTLKAARQEYEKAIADYKQAQILIAEMTDAEKGAQRVTDKLSDMFAKAGRQEQKEGNAQAKQDAGKALESYETALQHFEQALAIKRDHQDAQAGQREVREAMEKLHLQQGDKMTKAGERQLKNSPTEAVGNLMGALDHFEQARTLNPDNPEIPPRIEHVKKLLPEALVGMGKNEQKRAKEAEPESVPKAVSHLETAEAAYEKALQLAPDHQEAQKALKEVQEELDRLRKQLIQQSPPPPQQQQQKSQSQQQDQENFEEMLSELRESQKKREVTTKRSVGLKYDPASTPGLKNW